MPDMASITVKNAAGTDVVFNAGSPSSGDKTPAVWKQNAAGTSWAKRPSFQVTARNNASGSTRVIDGAFKFPIVDALGVITDVIPASFTFIAVNRVNADLNKDAFVQFGNLLASALMRSVAEEGFAPS